VKQLIVVIAAGATVLCCAGDFVLQNQAPLDIRLVIVHHMALNVAAGDLGLTSKVKTQDARRLPNPKKQKHQKFPRQKNTRRNQPRPRF